MPSWFLMPWSLSYAASATVALGLSVYIFLSSARSKAHLLFSAYGILSAAYLTVLFLKFNAPNEDIATLLFHTSNVMYILSIAMLLYFTKALAGSEIKDLYFFILPAATIAASWFHEYDVFFGAYGWSTIARAGAGGVVTFIYLMTYSLMIAYNLFHLAKQAKAPWVAQKYTLMVVGFVAFQLFGLIGFNAANVVLRSLPPVAGIFYFVSFIFIWYGLTLKAPTQVGVMQNVGHLTNSYRRFIDAFLQVAPTDDLGLKTLDFLEYLDKTRLSDVVTYEKLRIVLNANKMEQIDSIQALDKTVEYLEQKTWAGKLAYPFLGVLESVLETIRSDRERNESFKSVILKHREFLKKTDIIYGLSAGQFVELVDDDISLKDVPEHVAVLRFYKRLLLPARRFITGSIAPEFVKKIRSTGILRFLDFSEQGDIDTSRAESHVESIPEKQRGEVIRSDFNILMAWILRSLMETDPLAFSTYLSTLRRIARLNRQVKGSWKTYVSLVERASQELGRMRIRDMVLSEGYNLEDLDAFSSTVDLTHDKMLHCNTLVEYDPRYQYEDNVLLAMREISANSERCVVFSRVGSKILNLARNLDNVQVKPLVTPGVEEEGGVPFNDITRLLYAAGKELESDLETWIVFDNISDLVLSVGFDQAYLFMRRATDVISSKKASSIFLMNEGAHNQEIKSALEGLASKIAEISNRPRLIKG